MRKKPVYFLFILALTFSCNRAEVSSSKENVLRNIPEGAVAFITFDTTVVDLGNISAGETVIGWMDYKNEGESPLIIQSIKAGCGCTIPEWNKEPLQGGDEASIKVIFDSKGKRGLQNILITVNSNAENSKEELRLHAKVKN